MKDFDVVKTAVAAIDSKKGFDIKAIKITDLTVIADYFVIATATSNTHVRALAEEVEDKLSKQGVEPSHIEGRASDWVLLDYGSVVVHIFGKKSREFYSLDHMWNDGEDVDISEFIKEE